MAVTINLYPPIVDTYQKTFLINSESAEKNKCKIYFALPMYDSTSDIKNVQVTIRNQNTNLSVLNSTKYPSGIKITNLLTDVSVTTNDKYYIEILPSDIIDSNFIVNQYYKVQLRFTSTDASNPPITESSQPIDTWLAENYLYFSEWSTVTLTKGISVPTVTLQDFTPGATTEIYSTIANTQILGKLSFADPDEKETLKEYKITLYDENDSELINSGVIYANSNEFNYTLTYNLEVNNLYTMTLEFTTQNLYTETLVYYIDVIQATTPALNITIAATADEENGRFKIDLTRASTYGAYTGQVIIRRADSKSNYTIWDDMYSWNFNAAASIDLTWYDYTIESGIWYKYAVQGVTSQGARTPMTIIVNPVLVLFDHSFLTIGERQLKLKFDPQISNFKKIINENKIDTLGSKYPFIRRNGLTEYFQFSIGGLIASAMDEDGLFTTKDELYGSSKSAYTSYNQNEEVPEYRDFIYEKFFRDKVLDFLYNNNVKLFRSPTEGNIIIKLMDIQFQPNQTLGRMLWSFSGNAYEIDECNLSNYEKYGLVEKENPIPVVGSSLTPIKRIVIINNEEEFPAEGRDDVLYIYNRELYIWNSTNSVYYIISVPFWNHDPAAPVITPNNNLHLNNLYTDGQSLFQWNNTTENLDLISEPAYNNEYLGDAE